MFFLLNKKSNLLVIIQKGYSLFLWKFVFYIAFDTASKAALYLQLAFKYEKQVDNWNKLREYFNERIEVCDNRLSSPFCNFEKTTKERLIFSQCLEKLEELQGSDSNE